MSYSFQKNNSNAAVTVGELNQVVNGLERPYRVYTALLTQSGINPPVATVLENTIGDIVWSYYGVGDYIGTLAGAFPLDKTAVFIGGLDTYTGQGLDEIEVIATGDDILSYTSIEIRVYN